MHCQRLRDVEYDAALAWRRWQMLWSTGADQGVVRQVLRLVEIGQAHYTCELERSKRRRHQVSRLHDRVVGMEVTVRIDGREITGLISDTMEARDGMPLIEVAPYDPCDAQVVGQWIEVCHFTPPSQSDWNQRVCQREGG